MEQLTDTCINKQSDEINQNVIELDKISTNITKCIDEKATQYVKDFVNEMKQLSVLSGFEFLDANVKAVSYFFHKFTYFLECILGMNLQL